MKQQRDCRLDIIRCFAIWMIFTFHFCASLGLKESFFYGYRNGGWGSVGTALFFMISGYCLMIGTYRLENVRDVFGFYLKRFKSLYPMLWLVFLLGYLTQSMLLGNFTYGGNPAKLLLSLCGIDGYMLYFNIPNYYVTGEWFTTIIIIVYLLFPFLQWCFKKYRLVATIVLLAGYFIHMIAGKGPVPADAGVFTGILLFWIGMLLHEYQELLKKHWRWILPISIIIILIVMYVPLPALHGYTLPWKNLLAVALFLLIYLLLQFVPMKGERIQRIFGAQGKLCYAIYLCHHVLIGWVPLFAQKAGIGFGHVVIQYVVTLIVVEVISIGLYCVIHIRALGKMNI